MKESILNILKLADINASNVVVLGKYIHIDSFQKYNDVLQHVLTSSGFVIVKALDTLHLDGYKGYRVSAKLK
jgi:hypothetical protein